jgi:hypothetical protein
MQVTQPTFLGTQEAIIAHLFYAVSEIQCVTVHVGGHSVPGTLLWPESEHRTFGFVPDGGELPPAALPKPGRVLRVQYASLDDDYSFLTALKAVEPSGWRLSIPRQIDRNDRRMVPRQPVYNSRRFTLQLTSSGTSKRHLIVVDLSPSGMALIYDPRLDQFDLSRSYLGLLHVPNHQGQRLRFEVANMRPLDEGNEQRIIGCLFKGLGFTGCRTLAEILAIWED